MELHKKTCEQFAALPISLWLLQSKLTLSSSGTRRAKRCHDVTALPRQERGHDVPKFGSSNLQPDPSSLLRILCSCLGLIDASK